MLILAINKQAVQIVHSNYEHGFVFCFYKDDILIKGQRQKKKNIFIIHLLKVINEAKTFHVNM